MSETRQFIIFMLCVVNLFLAVWTFGEVISIRLAVDKQAVNIGESGDKR